ncbi:Lipoprotein LpqB, GerMN domain [Geobacter metallireducens RCH3]|uniref:Germane superfamily lipoprotein, putative n=1 Tax=Geobacter metallireducens (strain ATCC 53774 / DSM 7210 / GS-15) TaxID=269799 RepID=Q39VE5_GEOMG|nr:GerMN domain-containing protein [Geobacter metallireducens]ABB31779.1 germane superfamily lipoprotein, putative [Geobacter metallireducens GS-15]EHP89342.1 Lipoprotein LpqB, GerMN domain [Geobacter metallireducens RCH3]
MGKVRIALVAILVLIALAGCSKEQKNVPGKQVRVSATGAYEKYFGPAPTTDKGTCYAFVIYFPSAKEPGKVVPFPFFTFDQSSLKKVAVERLLGGMDVGSYKGEFLQLFAPGTRILGLAEQNDAVTVNFSKEILAAKADAVVEKALLDAVALTLSQFSGVREVRMQIEGKESGTVDGKDVAMFLGHGGPLKPQESAVLHPSPPRLLSVTAMKEKGAKEVEEVNVFFDRPLEIKELNIAGGDNKRFDGEVYHSVFDMAAVLKPKAPSLFKAGMPVKVRWKVTDKVGRSAEGAGEFPLEVQEH